MESEGTCQCLQMDRYEEYPKLKELVMRKDEMVSARATPPYYLKAHPPLTCRAELPGLLLFCNVQGWLPERAGQRTSQKQRLGALRCAGGPETAAAVCGDVRHQV